MNIDILWIASLVTALTTIVGMAWKFHTFLNRMEKKFEGYDNTITDNTIQILKMSLLCDDLPIVDRVEAGKKYIDMGGNGYGKVIYKQLLRELEEHPPTFNH